MANQQIERKHIDTYMTNFAQRYTSPFDAGEFVAPSFRVSKTSGKYQIHGKDNFRVWDDKINRRDPIREIDAYANDSTYVCEKHAVATFIDDDERDYYVDAPIRLEEEKIEHAKNAKERNRTHRVLAIAASTTLIPYTAIASAWATPGTATPVINILDSMIAVEAGCGLPANAIIMDYRVALNLIKATEWRNYFQYTDSGFDKGLFSAISGLRQLGLEPRLVNDRAVNSYEGCASDPGWETMLGDKVLIFHRETKPTLNSNAFMFSPYVYKDEVQRIVKEEERGWKFTVRDYIDELLVNADAGYILDDVL